MKKTLAILLALMMVLALAACGGSGAPAAEEPAPAEEPAAEEPVAAEEPAEEPAEEELSVVGEYTFVELSDMGASLWTLTLNEDGTFVVEQDNPFGDETVGEGEYEADGTPVYCGEIDAADFHGKTPDSMFADRLMGEFIDDGNAIEWVVDPENGTAVPAYYEGEVGTLDDFTPGGSGEASSGELPSIYGVYTYEEENDMGVSYWTLELHPDGTYVIEQDNPFGDETVGEGEFEEDGAFITCGPIDAADFHGKTEDSAFADRLMGEFVGEDNSTSWILNPMEGTMEPNV